MDHKPSVTAERPPQSSPVWNQIIDLFIRLSGWSLLFLLIVAYATGEEFQHTHGIIGYGIAALLVAGIFWELIRPHDARFSGGIYNLGKIWTLFRSATSGTEQPDALHTSAAGLVIILPILALLAASAVIIMLITHSFWGTTLVDEMHEVVAYFALGMVAFFLAAVVIASSAHVKHRVQSVVKGRSSSS
jgi:cytochrome b